MTLNTEEWRHLTISLLTAPTARDEQRMVGASNLSNQCDYCLACNLTGDARETPVLTQAWLGAVLGTALHGLFQDRVESIPTTKSEVLQALAQIIPGAVAEEHVYFYDYAGYGAGGGTIDLSLVDEIADWKGSTRKKSLLLQDYLEIAKGGTPRFGRTHQYVKLSEKLYQEEMAKVAYKVTGYFGQTSLYMLGREYAGRPASQATINWVNRDGTGYFDNPDLARYDDPTAVHDVWSLQFQYNEAYALGLVERGQRILSHLQGGGVPDDFDRNALCFPCGIDQEKAAKAATEVVELPVTVTRAGIPVEVAA